METNTKILSIKLKQKRKLNIFKDYTVRNGKTARTKKKPD